MEKYNLNLTNNDGDGIYLKCSGRIPNVGETIGIAIAYPEFERLIIEHGIDTELDQKNIRKLNDMFNSREYQIIKVQSDLEFKLKDLILSTVFVEAKEKK